MLESKPGLMEQVRNRFAHIDTCPFTGERIFFENAGGALTLKSVVETSAKFAAIPDNQGRANAASQALIDIIAKMRADTMMFLNAKEGQIFLGESGTELLFRLISTAVTGAAEGGGVISSTLEHPATRSAALIWSETAGKEHIMVAHDDATGSVDANDYCSTCPARYTRRNSHSHLTCDGDGCRYRCRFKGDPRGFTRLHNHR